MNNQLMIDTCIIIVIVIIMVMVMIVSLEHYNGMDYHNKHDHMMQHKPSHDVVIQSFRR